MTTLTTAVKDSTTMLGREFKHTFRFPLMLTASILMPVVHLLSIVSIFGGPIGHGLGNAPWVMPYVDFLVPDILMLTVAADSSTTLINICTDMTGVLTTGFRTMAVTRGAVLAGFRPGLAHGLARSGRHRRGVLLRAWPGDRPTLGLVAKAYR